MRTDATTAHLDLTFREGVPHSLNVKHTVIALGTFDGVHIAHRELLIAAQALRTRIGADLIGVWCFDESPAAIIQGVPPLSLASREERVKLLIEHGADFVVMGRFEELRDTEASDFLKKILVEKLGCVGTVCGYNHHFGYKGLGNSELLEHTFGKENTVTVPEIKKLGETVSSTAIREHILRGEAETANKMLGRAISITAPVTEGKRLGRKIGFPTANQTFPKDFVPLKRGVYATRCTFGDGKAYIGVSNVGVRPSIESGDDHNLNCETYIIDFSGELYGKDMKVEFCSYLREERKFSSLEELSRAIELDREHAIEYFAKNTD